MRVNVLKPTHENVLSAFLNDTIGRNEDLKHFIRLIWALEGSSSIAIDGMWGSGKTFFVKQSVLILEAYNDMIDSMSDNEKNSIKDLFERYNVNNEFEPVSYLPIYYDAWENDNAVEPVISLVYEITKKVGEENIFVKYPNFNKTALKIIDAFAKTNTNALLDGMKEDDLLGDIKQQKSKIDLIKEFLDTIHREKAQRIVIFIDELDRCKPDFAVKLLERIEHYFENENITFVFSVNLAELQHTIKKFYGELFDSMRYLNRFFDISISLPEIDTRRFYDIVNKETKRYIIDSVCVKVCKYFNFQLRDISKYYQTLNIAVHTAIHNENRSYFTEEKTMEFCFHYVIPIMIGVRFYDINKYYELKNGHAENIFIDILRDKDLRYSLENSLLSVDESYKDGLSKKYVTYNDKLKELYNLLFVYEYKGVSNAYKVFGQYEFSYEVREKLFRVDSLLSKYTNRIISQS